MDESVEIDPAVPRFLDVVWMERGLSANTLAAYRADLLSLHRWLVKQGRSLRSATRADLINQALDVLDEDPPWLLIGFTYHLPLWRSRVQGVDLGNRAFVEWGRIETVWLDA